MNLMFDDAYMAMLNKLVEHRQFLQKRLNEPLLASSTSAEEVVLHVWSGWDLVESCTFSELGGWVTYTFRAGERIGVAAVQKKHTQGWAKASVKTRENRLAAMAADWYVGDSVGELLRFLDSGRSHGTAAAAKALLRLDGDADGASVEFLIAMGGYEMGSQEGSGTRIVDIADGLGKGKRRSW